MIKISGLILEVPPTQLPPLPSKHPSPGLKTVRLPRKWSPFFFWWRMNPVFGCLKFLRSSCHHHWVGTAFIIKVEARFRGWSLKEHSYHPEEFKSWVLRISEGAQHRKTILKQQMPLYLLLRSVVSKGSVKEFKSKEFQGTREQNMWQNLLGASGLSCSTLLTTDRVFKTCLLILKYTVESC